MARIAFIGTGGTLANAGTGISDYLSYLSRGKVLPAKDVLDLAPDLSGFAELIPHTYAARRSKEIGPKQWLELRAVLSETLADPAVDGVIIGHGTGVLEETAFFLHLALDTVKPVVVVGAQRPPTTLGSDAHKNILDAVHWIRAQNARAQNISAQNISAQNARAQNISAQNARAQTHEKRTVGVVVIMDQVVHSARGVMKLANHTLGAMESPISGPVARVNVDGTISFYREPYGRHTVTSEFSGVFARSDDGASADSASTGIATAGVTPVSSASEGVARADVAPAGAQESLPRVDVVVQYAGADATAMNAHVAAGARGIILEGFPPGTNTPELDAAIERHAAAGVVVVQASRAIRDPRILPRDGLGKVVRNSDLSPQQARILLILALARGYDSQEIQRVFDEY